MTTKVDDISIVFEAALFGLPDRKLLAAFFAGFITLVVIWIGFAVQSL